MRVDGVYFSVRLGGSVRAFVQVRDETVERTGSLRGLSQTAKWALFVSNMAASDGHVVCLLLVAGVGICVGGAEDVRRLDPGSDLTVTWAVDPPARLEQYDVINVTVNDSDVLLSCLPAVQRCEDVRAKDRSLRFVLVFADVAVDVSNASVSDVEANITNDDENSATKRADVIQVGFELRNVRVTDAGRYSLSLIIENSTDTEHRVVLYVYLPPTNPVVLGTLSEQKAGEEAALWCNKSLIQSVPVAYRDWSLLVYKWYRNDELIQKDQGPLIRLNLTKADDKASYRCSVQEGNSSIETSSGVFMLNVIYVDDVRLDVDEPTGLVCRSDCNPECSYRWLDASGTVLSNSSSLSPSEEISGVRLTCEASNKVGTTSQSIFMLVVRSRSYRLTYALVGVFPFLMLLVVGIWVGPAFSQRSEPPRSEPPRSEPPRGEPPRGEPPRSEGQAEADPDGGVYATIEDEPSGSDPDRQADEEASSSVTKEERYVKSKSKRYSFLLKRQTSNEPTFTLARFIKYMEKK